MASPSVGLPSAPHAPLVLVVGSIGDPATPYRWAQRCAAPWHRVPRACPRSTGWATPPTGISSATARAAWTRWVDRYLLKSKLRPAGTVRTARVPIPLG